MAHQRTVTKNRYIFSIIKAKKIHILYAYTGDQNKNGKKMSLGRWGVSELTQVIFGISADR